MLCSIKHAKFKILRKGVTKRHLFTFYYKTIYIQNINYYIQWFNVFSVQRRIFWINHIYENKGKDGPKYYILMMPLTNQILSINNTCRKFPIPSWDKVRLLGLIYSNTIDNNLKNNNI